MSRRSNQFKLDNLARFLLYVLGHRPDEFGLVPDGEGFVPLKELLQAIHEEPSWGHVRQSHINEVLCSPYRSRFHSEEERLKAATRVWDPFPPDSDRFPPKILYTAVRRKAHPVVMDKGVLPPEGKPVVLSGDASMALRIGTRKDRKPVVLEVSTAAGAAGGVQFRPFLSLFVCDYIPAGCIMGPPVHREPEERTVKKEEKHPAPAPGHDGFTQGTFLLDPFRDPDRARRIKGKKRKGWKEEARETRRKRQG